MFARDHKTNAASSKQLLIRTDIKTKNKTHLICKLFDENGVSNTLVFSNCDCSSPMHSYEKALDVLTSLIRCFDEGLRVVAQLCRLWTYTIVM